jgi:UDP-N-acetylmuramoylalanine--D-glutamate ligase
LIAGGDAKGADMRELQPAVKAKVKELILIGKDAPLITETIAGLVPVHQAKNIQEAVKVAAGLAKPGDNVLLSPACASLDQFRDYKDRGDQFSKAVRELAL